MEEKEAFDKWRRSNNLTCRDCAYYRRYLVFDEKDIANGKCTLKSMGCNVRSWFRACPSFEQKGGEPQ